jgi:hypothetical protein
MVEKERIKAVVAPSKDRNIYRRNIIVDLIWDS